jgi:NIPSNAP
VIVEERDYHVHTGHLAELVRLYAEEGLPIQEEILGGLVGAFTVDVGQLSVYTHLWRYAGYDDRAQRRARLGADARWQGFLPKITPLIHTQTSRILLPTPYSPIQ